MTRGAGILFISLDGTALFLKRAPASADFAGYWDFPGGGCLDGEEAEDCAKREAREEIGSLPAGERRLHTRTKPVVNGVGSSATPRVVDAPAPPIPIDFTTFVQSVPREFVPTLNDEHTGYAWAPISSPPEPLHPGCRVALDRISMNELDIARAIADGRLASPQRYENVTLVAIRITGTGIAYRPKLNEYVYRLPENYLTQEFLDRCNGLPVIVKHPEKQLLDAKEYRDRNVGSIFLPYIAGDEVWGIAKVHDDDGIDWEKLSTSPAVLFGKPEVNEKITLENGRQVLIEGDPSLLDHVALCELGVWDKGKEPTGVRSEVREDSSMAESEKEKEKEEERKADDAMKRDDAPKYSKRRDDDDDAKYKARHDAEEEAERKFMKDAGCAEHVAKDRAGKHRHDSEETEMKERAAADEGQKIDKVLSHLTALHSRMDEIEAREKSRGDGHRSDAEENKKKEEAERLAADKKKRDDEADAAKKRDDAARADAVDREAMRAKIAELEARLPKDAADTDYHAVISAQARADEVFSKLGESAPKPLSGETEVLYERRVARLLKEHSPTWKGIDLGAAFADDATGNAGFKVALAHIYDDAEKAAAHPAPLPGGGLRAIHRRSGAGHEIIEYVGDGAWMDRFSGPIGLHGTVSDMSKHSR